MTDPLIVCLVLTLGKKLMKHEGMNHFANNVVFFLFSFNQLDLPAYETYDKLRSYMLKAIHECSEGFGFA